MTEPRIDVKIEQRAGIGPVGFVKIDNSGKLNCLSTALIVALRQAFDRLATNHELRAAVLTGAGDRAFIGGADLAELSGLCADSARLFITRLHMACKAIRECPVPVIARINGFCLGAGLEVAASCDFRVAADSAVLGMPEVHMGLPSVIEAALLPGLIGWGKTREILITGETFSATDAHAMGLVEKVMPAARIDEHVDHWLALIGRGTPGAVRAQKALMNRWERVSVAEGVYAGIDALSDSYKTGEPQAAIKAFFDAKEKAKNTK